MDRVYVANLPPDIRIKDIDDFFRPFGKLVYIDVNHRSNPVYAYVQFDNPRNAFNAVKARHGYDYEGYTIQLRLVENEVKRHRDVTPPPPPPPPMFNNHYEGQNVQNGYNNNSGSNRMVQNSQWPNNNQSDMEQFHMNNRSNLRPQNMDFSSNNRSQQLNMMPYESGNRSSMEQQFSNTNLSNMQQFSNSSRSNMQMQFSNFNRSNFQEQHPMGRSNIPQSNNFANRQDIIQQNMTPYSSFSPSNIQGQFSNASRSNIPQLQNMNIQFSNGWDARNNSKDWNNGNFGNDNRNNYGNAAVPNVAYNANNDPYANQGLEEKYTIGLSGSGRKWFNRYMAKGFSPETARAKALEHRKLPYLRGEAKTMANRIDPTNAALETIGNTLISILSANPGDVQPGFSNNMGVNNIQMPGSSAVAPQANAVSRRQYRKSLDKLKMFKGIPVKSNNDNISIKYHTQIVKDYEKFNKVGFRNENKPSLSTSARNEPLKKTYRPVISTRTEQQISELMIKQKGKLLKKARELSSEARNKRLGGAYKKRARILMDHGFLEIEAKSLAWNPLDTLEELLSLKREYDLIAKKTVFIPASKASLANAPKAVVYRNDLQYLEEYAKHRINGLSKTILYGLKECLKRIHDYERSEHIPLTENKFTKLLVKITSREDFFKSINKTSRKKRTPKSKTDKKSDDESNKQELDKEVAKSENQDGTNATEDNKVVNEKNIVDEKEKQDEDTEEHNQEYDDDKDEEGEVYLDNEEDLDNGEEFEENEETLDDVVEDEEFTEPE